MGVGQQVILPTAYFGNIEYYSILLKYDNILIEGHENYVKQTFRNRCVIATANGSLILTVPVHFSNTEKTKIKDVKIDYSKNWQKQHFKAIESAYQNSPFYDFFKEDFMFVFEKKETFLFDLNHKILHSTLGLIKEPKNISVTSKYLGNIVSAVDFRDILRPELQNAFKVKPYYQIFFDRNGFLNNLSILDLLFCEGKLYS